MAYICTNCGGELHYEPSLGKLKCEFCENVYDISEYEDQPETAASSASNQSQSGHEHFHDHSRDHDHSHTHIHPDLPGAGEEILDVKETVTETIPNKALDLGFDKATDDTTDIKEDLRLYQCPHCGAEVVTDKTTTATNCVFCNTPLVLQENMQGDFKPELVIPFEIDKKQIEKLYEDYIKDKPFYPDEYSTANVIEKIKAVYLPYWLYDIRTSGDIKATGEILTTHTTPNWIVTNHNVYALNRQGHMDFTDIPVVSSSKTPRNAADSIEPYDYSKMVPFQKGYLPGFLAERWDIKESECADPAKARAQSTFENALTSSLGGYSNIKIQNGHMDHALKDGSYALMPAYLLFMDYDQDEDKLIAINGQSGKVAGNIPVDNKKRMKFFIIRFLMLFVIFLVVFLLFFVLL